MFASQIQLMPENMPVIVTKEKLKGKMIYVAECPLFNVSSQGETLERSLENLKEALISYFKSPYADKSKLKIYEEVIM